MDLLEKESKYENSNDLSSLQRLVDELTSKEVSVLQLIDDSSGVITLNEQDYSYIEKLCRASLSINNEYFLTHNMPMTFDFLYIQSYVIREHFLHCRINYQSVAQKYQCYIRQTRAAKTSASEIDTLDLDEKYTVPLSGEQLETDWNHLKEMTIDKLYHGCRLLTQIALILKDKQDDRSADNIYDFIESTDDNADLHQQLKLHEVKNFKLCHIDSVRRLYATSTQGFEHLFTDVHHSLRVSLSPESDKEFTSTLTVALINVDHDNDIDKINRIIEEITKFLNELKEVEDTLLQYSNQSLRIICEQCISENPILSLTPDYVKCENYVSVNVHLIKVRSVLQERIIDINEKARKSLWHEQFDTSSFSNTEQQENRFQKCLNEENRPVLENQHSNNAGEELDLFGSDKNNVPYGDVLREDLLSSENYMSTERYQTTTRTTDDPNPFQMDCEDTNEYAILFELVIKVVPLLTSTFIQEIHVQRQKKEEAEVVPLTKPQRFAIAPLDGKIESRLWKCEKLFEQLRKLFQEKKYDSNTYAVIDADKIFLNFSDDNTPLPRRMKFEYKILEKSSLVEVEFHFQTKTFRYFVTSNAKTSTIIDRFIHDNNLQLLSVDIYLNFTDEFGKCITGETIADLSSEKLIKITVTEETTDTSTLCEVTLRVNEGEYSVYRINASLIRETFLFSTFFLDSTGNSLDTIYFYPDQIWLNYFIYP